MAPGQAHGRSSDRVRERSTSRADLINSASLGLAPSSLAPAMSGLVLVMPQYNVRPERSCGDDPRPTGAQGFPGAVRAFGCGSGFWARFGFLGAVRVSGRANVQLGPCLRPKAI